MYTISHRLLYFVSTGFLAVCDGNANLKADPRNEAYSNEVITVNLIRRI